jgi:hypothetical protein
MYYILAELFKAWDIPQDISQLSDKMGCIQMYISFVYIDTYAIQGPMLLFALK